VPTLTAFAPDPRQPGYRLLEVDRGRFASLPEEALAGLPLESGRGIGPPVLARLQELADLEAAYRAALRVEARRSHARNDLRRRLIQKQNLPAAVDGALTRLLALGVLDDARFARSYAATRLRRGRGPARVLTDLLIQGVERRVAEAAVAQAMVDEGVDPEEEVRALAERRVRQLADVPRLVRKRRLTAYLLRRGWSGGTVRALVTALCG